MTLSDINLGRVDGSAESELSEFFDLFYKDDTLYEQLKDDHSTFLITGKKGVGKTLLSRHFMKISKDEKPNTIYKSINLANVQSAYLTEFNDKSDHDMDYIVFLEYYLLTEIARIIVSSDVPDNLNYIDKFKLYCRRQKLHKFMCERFPNTNYLETDINIMQSVELDSSIKSKKAKIGGKANSQTKATLVKNKYYNVKSALQKLVISCLEYINIILTTDDLDEINILNSITKVQYNKFIICYIHACKEINSILNDNSRCIILIRDDILNSLNSSSGNFNKIIADSSIKIDWMETKKTNPWDYKISKMIFKKIKYSCDELKEKTDKEIYELLFPSEIQGYDTFYFLITYCYGRPREIIYWLNKIIDKYGNECCFKSGFFNDVMPTYSNHLLGEKKNEMAYYFDNEYIEQLFELIMHIDKKVFKMQQVEFAYKQRPSQYSKIQSIEKAINDLYDFGIIGIKRNESFSWAFRIEGKRKIIEDDKFTLHFGLRKVLLSK